LQLLLFVHPYVGNSHVRWYNRYLYTWVDNNLVLVEQLDLNQFYGRHRVWRERRLINGYWQESELCFLYDDNYTYDGRWRYGEFCESYLRIPGVFGEYEYWDGIYDPDFYQRLFGEAYWNVGRGFIPADLSQELRPFKLQE